MKYVLVPVEPTDALLRSMATRYAHDFGLLGSEIQQTLMTMMRQIHEEVVGTGFYRAPSPSWIPVSERLPTREDADEVGNVWIARLGRDGELVVTPFPDDLVAQGCYPDNLREVYWMPKPRQQPPAPPTAAPESP